MKKIKAKDLKLGDEILLNDYAAYMCCTVNGMSEHQVKLFRPFVHTADFSYTGGVICYVGIEEFSIHKDEQEYTLYSRKEIK